MIHTKSENTGEILSQKQQRAVEMAKCVYYSSSGPSSASTHPRGCDASAGIGTHIHTPHTDIATGFRHSQALNSIWEWFVTLVSSCCPVDGQIARTIFSLVGL